MPEKTLHERLIDELLDYRTVLTPREAAAAWEIRVLRAELEGRPIEEITHVQKIVKPKATKKPVKKTGKK